MKSSYIGMIVLSTVLLALISIENTSDIREFIEWKNEHSITYESQEEDFYRSRIFYENLKKINFHNSNSSRKYEMGLTQFAGLTQQEFEAKYLQSLITPSLKTS